MTKAQIVHMNMHQACHETHPMTCANRNDGQHVEFFGDIGVLIATDHGWTCPFCDYRQPFTPPSFVAPAPREAPLCKRWDDECEHRAEPCVKCGESECSTETGHGAFGFRDHSYVTAAERAEEDALVREAPPTPPAGEGERADAHEPPAVHHKCRPSNLAGAPNFAEWCYHTRTWRDEAAQQDDFKCSHCGAEITVNVREWAVKPSTPSPALSARLDEIAWETWDAAFDTYVDVRPSNRQSAINKATAIIRRALDAAREEK